MAEVKTIKGVDENTWREFKVLAAESDMKMATLLKIMIEEYKKKSKRVWNEILKGEKIISDESAKKMEKISKKIRGEYGFRI